ncbi:MAG: HD domain-containing protein [Puniceicoccales bacterium]|jgi:[protein-PII] uridylyltransferase|nr:HD domain-containing protein [Puniceicoccales bacterium]
MPPSKLAELERRVRQHAAVRLGAETGGTGTTGDAGDARWLAGARRFLRAERQILYREHRHGTSGIELARWRSTVLDVFLQALFARALRGSSPDECAAVALVAHGGYGRGELCPCSDIDIMLVFDGAAPAFSEQLRERVTGGVLYPLWDLRLKPGHASRTIAETLEQSGVDAVTRNTLLDSRLVAGAPEIFEKLAAGARAALLADGARSQVRHLLRQMGERRARFGGSVFVQEPNIKEGVGGLRDFHTLAWLARLASETGAGGGGALREVTGGGAGGVEALAKIGWLTAAEARAATDAYSRLLRVRSELHFQTQPRHEEVLSLERQPGVAAALAGDKRATGTGGSDGTSGERAAERDSDREQNWIRQIEDLMRAYYEAAETIRQTVGAVAWRFGKEGTGTTGSEGTAGEGAPAAAGTAFDGFVLRGGVLSAARADVFAEEPSRLVRVFRHAQQFNAAPDFPLLRLVRENLALLKPATAAGTAGDAATSAAARAAACFLAILADGGRVAPALELMHEAGVLCRLLPEFSGVRCLVQREIFHRYTVDVHTLLCLRELDAVFRATGDAGAVMRYRDALFETGEPALLYLALLLHDIGKQFGVARHAITGAELAANVLRRLGVRGAAADMVLWLVRSHLDMAEFWRRHDLDDPANIAAFAATVGDPRRLRYLYALTYCDSRATTPELWNDYKHSLHTQLYRGALRILEGGRGKSGGTGATGGAPSFDKVVSAADTDAVLQEFFHGLANANGLGALAPVTRWRALGGGVSEVTIATWDREGLFHKLAGAFTVAGASILAAKASVRADRVALDTFHVFTTGDDGAPAAAALSRALEDALVHGVDHEEEILRLRAEADRRADARPPRERHLRADTGAVVSVAAAPPRRIEVAFRAADRPGLLFFATRLFYRRRLNLTFARVDTELGEARDAFYLEPFAGDPDLSPAELADLRAALTAELAASQ